MAIPFFFLLLLPVLSSPLSSAASSTLSKGSSLSVENTNDVLISPSAIFSAGFFPVGDNAFCFSIWFIEPFCRTNCSVIWMANRDQPVNGKKSKLSLLHSGNLLIIDAGQSTVWATDTASQSWIELQLHDNGNLFLYDKEGGRVLWQSFDYPTDTLLPQQPLIKDRQLVSTRSRTNYSSGVYKLYFDSDNVLRLLYDGPQTSSIYWPNTWLLTWDGGRSTFNSTRIALFDSSGNFSSSDDFTFLSLDYGMGAQRILKIDFDGNLRLYSRENGRNKWIVSWQAVSQPCRIHGICGPNSLCNYVPSSGRRCSCLPGFKAKDYSNWSLGCEPEVNRSCSTDEISYLKLSNVEFFGYEYGFFPNYTVPMCEDLCSKMCNCKGFQLRFSRRYYPSNIPYCYPKTALLNGQYSPNFDGDIYLKVPRTSSLSSSYRHIEDSRLDCSVEAVVQLNRTYSNSHENGTSKSVLWFACGVGVIEFLSIALVWYCLIRNQNKLGAINQGYFCIETCFRKFTLSEIKTATKGFREEIGRGGGGIVYKGILSDHRVAAIKLLNEANQGEEEFLAEVSTIGKLNHMNLIEMWGFCAEGKHRLLVYKYMEHGSLAENLLSGALDWKQRFDIAVGTAKGLAYLHEECLEWVLHCDVKPQNILLDSDYQPKVSDFGLSRLLKRGSSYTVNSRFSRIRGTRGYMAPEWVFNLPITSKVDVYSYGIVLLEIVTGKSPTVLEMEHQRLLIWVREKMKGADEAVDSWMEMIIDPKLEGKYDKTKMEILVMVALKCVSEDRDARPTMSQAVEMLNSAHLPCMNLSN